MTTELLGAGDVAELLDTSSRTVQRLAKSGELPFEYKVPGTRGAYLFSRGVVEMYLRQRENAA